MRKNIVYVSFKWVQSHLVANKSFLKYILNFNNDKNNLSPLPLRGFLFDIGNQQAQIFQKEYKDLYQEKPDWIAPSYYDSMLLAVNAFRKMSLNDNLAIEERRQTIKDILLSFNSYEKAINGVTGHIYMNKNGVVIQPYYVGVYYDQKLVSALDQYQMTPEISSVNE